MLHQRRRHARAATAARENLEGGDSPVSFVPSPDICRKQKLVLDGLDLCFFGALGVWKPGFKIIQNFKNQTYFWFESLKGAGRRQRSNFESLTPSKPQNPKFKTRAVGSGAASPRPAGGDPEGSTLKESES